MEPTPPFELDELRRDWIDGISGEAFYRKVQAVRTSLEGSAGPLIIREDAPIAFAVKFLTGAYLRLPLVLANPSWGNKERGQFDQLMASGELGGGSILIPTGGTTAGVKLAIHDWASLHAAARAAQDFLGGGTVDSCCVLPLHHVSGLMQLMRSFISGGSIRFNDNETGGRCLSLVPTQLQRLMKTAAGIHKMNTARAVFVGGAAMPRPVAQKARALRLPLVPVYGMTETAAMIAAVPHTDFLASTDAGAVPLGDTQISIDPDGSIRVRSSALFKGYLGSQPINSSEGFRTGDAGWFDGQGRLHLQGRMDALINTGGEKVDPVEVQEALLQLKGVEEARVVGEPDEDWGEVVVAYIRPAAQLTMLNEADLLRSLRKQLSPYKVPKQIRLFGASHASGH